MIALNEDAKDIVLSNYEGNSLESVINDEYIYEVKDVYGTPDENGQSYVYEYHVSKTTGQITSKNKIRVLN